MKLDEQLTESQKKLETAEAQNADLKAENERLKAEAKTREAEGAARDQARALPNLTISQDDLTAVLVSVNGLPKEQSEAFHKALKALDAQAKLAADKLGTAAGHDQVDQPGTTANDKLMGAAQKLVDTGKCADLGEAILKAREENPELAAQVDQDALKDPENAAQAA